MKTKEKHDERRTPGASPQAPYGLTVRREPDARMTAGHGSIFVQNAGQVCKAEDSPGTRNPYPVMVADQRRFHRTDARRPFSILPWERHAPTWPVALVCQARAWRSREVNLWKVGHEASQAASCLPEIRFPFRVQEEQTAIEAPQRGSNMSYHQITSSFVFFY